MWPSWYSQSIRAHSASLRMVLAAFVSIGTNFLFSFFFFNDTAILLIYTLSLHDALPIFLYGNLPPREISMKDVFRSGDSSKKFKIAEGQWYRYAPSYVSPAYHLLEGFPFIQEPPSGDLQER